MNTTQENENMAALAKQRSLSGLILDWRVLNEKMEKLENEMVETMKKGQLVYKEAHGVIVELPPVDTNRHAVTIRRSE